MSKRDIELAEQATTSSVSYFDGRGNVHSSYLDREKFADLIRADERARLERAIAELAPVASNPILQNQPAAFWIKSFTQIVREAP
jgi:hypothetical protein